MAVKNDSIAMEHFHDLTGYQKRFVNAVQNQDMTEMTLAFCELENLSLLLIADICDEPSAKVKLLEAMVASKESLEIARKLLDGSRF